MVHDDTDIVGLSRYVAVPSDLCSQPTANPANSGVSTSPLFLVCLHSVQIHLRPSHPWRVLSH